MGLFGNSYYKAGPGISEEQAKKRSYFEILGRKFWSLVKLNMLYVLLLTPIVGASWFLCVGYGGFTGILQDVSEALASGKYVLLPILPFLPCIFIGPATAGFSYVLRNYCRQEHAFIASDFFEHTKKNFKQSILASTLGTLFVYLFFMALLFYVRVLPPFMVIAIAVLVALIFVHISYYVFPIMITFDMKFYDIIKNSLIFAVAKFPQNILITIVVFGVNSLLLWHLPVVWVILAVIILPAWSGFTMNYYTWGVIEEYMIERE